MAKAEWGSKRICLSCGAKFYDLNRTPIHCPACETVFDPAANSKPRRSRTPAKAAVVVAPPVVVAAVAVEPDDEEDVLVEEGESVVVVADDDADEESDTESAIEDVSELGDDDEDMSDVIVAEIDDSETER